MRNVYAINIQGIHNELLDLQNKLSIALQTCERILKEDDDEKE